MVGPPSSSSESEEELDMSPSPFLSLLSFWIFFIVASIGFEPLSSTETEPDTDGEELESGIPESCNFFFMRSSAEDEADAPEDLTAMASRPPVLAAGVLKLTRSDPFSVIILVLVTDTEETCKASASCFFLNSVISLGICQLLT